MTADGNDTTAKAESLPLSLTRARAVFWVRENAYGELHHDRLAKNEKNIYFFYFLKNVMLILNGWELDIRMFKPLRVRKT